MKKPITVLLTLSLMISVSVAFADINWGTKTLNEAETAGYALSMFLGDPLLINAGKTDPVDEMNSRCIFINSPVLGCDLGVTIRISDTQMFFWALDLTPENLLKAKLALDENAPLCSVVYYEGFEMKDSAVYYKAFSSILTYERFKNDVERITSSLASGDMSATTGTADPILACFPGLSWGMTIDEMINAVGKDLFTELKTETGTSVMASPEVFGKTVLVLFVFNNDNLNMFDVMIDKEDYNQYLEALTQAYGKPHQTTQTGALNGKLSNIKDDPTGDCYAWKTNKSLIILDSISVSYWSLYN